jgi:general secretion pathway protein F
MTLFRYKAVGADGKHLDGVMEAANAQQVIAQLQAAGHYPIDAVARASRRPGTLRWLRQYRQGIRSADVTVATRELATLLAAGVAIDGALRIMERHAHRAPWKLVLKEIHHDVHSGKSLSAAMAKHDAVFDPLYTSLIRAGEASGALDVATQRLADYRERSDALRSKLISALTYPAILACVAVISLFVLMSFVVPQFVPLFSDAGATLPWLTQLVFATSEYLGRLWWVLLGSAIAAKLAMDGWLRVPGNRKRLHGWILRAPVVGELTRLVETVRFAGTLETLLRNGLPLLRSLKLAKQVARNEVVVAALDRCIADVHAGGRVAPSLARESVLSALAIDLISMGEESGQLEDMLERAAKACDAKLQQRLKQLLVLLEPVLILGLGGVIAVVIIAILMAMLGLNELVI